MPSSMRWEITPGVEFQDPLNIGLAANHVMTMTVVQTAMLAKHSALRDAILTHRTMAEGLMVLFAAVPALTMAGAEKAAR